MIRILTIIFTLLIPSASVFKKPNEMYSITVEVHELRNSKGEIQFALYNKEGSIPDKDYSKIFKKLTGEIIENSSSVTFANVPEGTYAVNILHDEDKNGKIDKGLILPKEGIGFSNYQSIGLTHRPNFSKASFVLKSDTTISIKVIYM